MYARFESLVEVSSSSLRYSLGCRQYSVALVVSSLCQATRNDHELFFNHSQPLQHYCNKRKSSYIVYYLLGGDRTIKFPENITLYKKCTIVLKSDENDFFLCNLFFIFMSTRKLIPRPNSIALSCRRLT